MPGDTLNNIGYIDVQFGGLDFVTDDTFDALPEKFNAAVTIDQQQLVQSQQDVGNDYQTKNSVAQQQQQQAAAAAALTAGLQNSQIVSNNEIKDLVGQEAAKYTLLYK